MLNFFDKNLFTEFEIDLQKDDQNLIFTHSSSKSNVFQVEVEMKVFIKDFLNDSHYIK